jgi:hypothetical protein
MLEERATACDHCRWNGLRSLPRSTGEPEGVLSAVPDLAPHPTFFPAYLASPFTFPHPINRPFGNGAIKRQRLGDAIFEARPQAGHWLVTDVQSPL